MDLYVGACLLLCFIPLPGFTLRVLATHPREYMLGSFITQRALFVIHSKKQSTLAWQHQQGSHH